MRLHSVVWALIGALCASSAFSAVRPHSLEQYIADTIGWPSSITHGKYQAKYEWAFMDSAAGDTCEPTYPFSEFMISEGLSTCYDLRPPNWANVSCSGASAQHPSLSNVYIMRPSSPNWGAANSSSYRWVLFCPGSYASASNISITADGVGFGAGQMRIYDCLDANGSYDPMRYGVTRTGTSDECHVESVLLNDARYTWFRSFYFEGTSKEWTRPAFEIRAPSSTQKMFSGLDNFDLYGGGQTALGNGYKTTFTIEIERGYYSHVQNGRIVDCLARKSADDKPVASVTGQTSFYVVANLEIVNCAYLLSGQDADTSFWVSEGGRWENIWQTQDGARFMDEIDFTYWSAAYASGSKIPYGHQGGGQPPSYVKSTAVSAAQLNDSFECAADKFSDACPFICSETMGVSFKKGALNTNEPHKVRRMFVDNGRISRCDDNNPTCNERTSQCGGSSGTQGAMARMGGQYNACGIEYDLIFTTGPGYSPHVMLFSNYTNTCVGIKVTNSVWVATYESWMDNVYIDDWYTRVFQIEDNNTISGGDNEYIVWGSTYQATGYENATPGTWTDQRWLGSRNGVDVTMNCTTVIDFENDAPAATLSVTDMGRYGNAGIQNGATNVIPSNTLGNTLPKSELVSFTHITRPFTAIANNGPVTTRTHANLIPATGSAIQGQCTVAAP